MLRRKAFRPQPTTASELSATSDCAAGTEAHEQPKATTEARESASKRHRSNDNSSSRLGSGGRLLKGLPWAWIALSGFATLLWFAGIGWVAVKLFRWVTD